MQGKLTKRYCPEGFRNELPPLPKDFKRVVGIDLGTNCGFAFCDIPTENRINLSPITAGIWDLSTGPYETGPLRHIRFKELLTATQPDFIAFEDVKYTPPGDVMKLKKFGAPAILARAAPALEFLGGLKVTLTTWAEERKIPVAGFGIGVIKKFATGRGNANKEDMIRAAIEQFGIPFVVDNYESTGEDNIADAIFVCALAVETYGLGIRCIR